MVLSHVISALAFVHSFRPGGWSDVVCTAAAVSGAAVSRHAYSSATNAAVEIAGGVMR